MQTMMEQMPQPNSSRTISSMPAATKPDTHVMMPDSVDLPLPRTFREEISIPASINGRDLSNGRL
jgi:hypothetical protein